MLYAYPSYICYGLSLAKYPQCPDKKYFKIWEDAYHRNLYFVSVRQNRASKHVFEQRCFSTKYIVKICVTVGKYVM